MIERMYRVILEFAANSGLSAPAAARAFANAQSSAGRSQVGLGDPLNFEVMLKISEVFKAWYGEPDYLDARGAPAALALAGAKSFKSLMARFLPDYDAGDIAQWLIGEGLLGRSPTNLLVPNRRSVVFSRPNAMTLDRVPYVLQGLLSTVHHNHAVARQPRDRRCEQLATIDRFRVADLPRFHREIKKFAPHILNQIETWALPYQEPEDSPRRVKTTRVCVEVFASSEEHALKGARRRKS
jgi:hypothetical protein